MSKFRKQPLVKELVADVLSKNKNGYLTIPDIAEQAFSTAYGAYTYKALDEKVKRSIYGAISILAERGLLVIGQKNTSLKNNPIDRWKIAGVEDKEETITVLEEKTNRLNGFINSRKAFVNNAAKKELLPESLPENLKLTK